ncbi:unnamed protein product [Caenorhabditis auriculariae]|uniref:Degenerin deg-1 n=1 Tax=Caenorhabditis auriculariae TaxID=2777116 RepID=A0A8S1H0D8_9PELO|nr:unnamed protein product [Caenorhabditis auriculariae]
MSTRKRKDVLPPYDRYIYSNKIEHKKSLDDDYYEAGCCGFTGFIKRKLLEFADKTTAHGAKRILIARNKFAAFLWGLIIAVFLLMFLYQAAKLIVKYNAHEKITDISLKFDHVEFPAITFCNLNPYKKSLVMMVPSIRDTMDVYDNAKTHSKSEEEKKKPKKTRKQHSDFGQKMVMQLFAKEIEEGMEELRKNRQYSLTSSDRNKRAAPFRRYEAIEAHCKCVGSLDMECIRFESPPRDATSKCVCTYDREMAVAWPCFNQSIWYNHECPFCHDDGYCEATLAPEQPLNSTWPCMCRSRTEDTLLHWKSWSRTSRHSETVDRVEHEHQHNDGRTYDYYYHHDNNNNNDDDNASNNDNSSHNDFYNKYFYNPSSHNDIHHYPHANDDFYQHDLYNSSSYDYFYKHQYHNRSSHDVFYHFYSSTSHDYRKTILHLPPPPKSNQRAIVTNPETIKAMGFSGMTDGVAMLTKAKENLMFTMAALSVQQRIALSQSKHEFIEMCSFNGKECDIDEDFRLHVDPEFGNCFTFNYDVNNNYTSSRAGPMYGIRVLLFVNTSDYMSTSESSGLQLASQAVLVSKRKIMQRLPAPYGECVESKEINNKDYIYTGYDYHPEGCHRSCFQSGLIEDCSCGDPRFPVPEGKKHCSAFNATARSCLEKNIGSVGDFHHITEKMHNCVCKQSCTEIIHEVTFSASKWPSGATDLGDCEGMTEKECEQYYRLNAAMVEVFYEQLNYELLQESEAYGLVNLIADFGGHLGLWLGFSVITVIEVAVLIANIFSIFFKKAESEKLARQASMQTSHDEKIINTKKNEAFVQI